MKKERKKLFSVTAKDLRFDFFRGSGPGGQHKNKTSSACRCTHKASGAVGAAQEDRSQHKNKEIAFKRMVETDKFKAWLKLESSRSLGVLDNIEREVEEELKKVRVEGKDDSGKWVKI